MAGWACPPRAPAGCGASSRTAPARCPPRRQGLGRGAGSTRGWPAAAAPAQPARGVADAATRQRRGPRRRGRRGGAGRRVHRRSFCARGHRRGNAEARGGEVNEGAPAAGARSMRGRRGPGRSGGGGRRSTGAGVRLGFGGDGGARGVASRWLPGFLASQIHGLG